MCGTMRTPVRCILVLLTWTATVNARHTPVDHTSSEQKILQADSVVSRDPRDVTNRGTSNALANAIQQLMLLQQQQQQQEEDRLAQEALSHQQQQGNENDSQETFNQQQQWNESWTDEALSLQLQEPERRTQESLRLQEQRTETALREAARQMEQQLQGRDEAIRVLRLSVDERMQRVEDQLTVLVHQQTPPTMKDGCGCAEGALIDQLEKKLTKLEGMFQGMLTEQRERLRVKYRILEAEEKRIAANISQLGEDLCKAAFDGRVQEVRRLLDAGADVNYTSPNCFSPLISAFFIPFQYGKADPDVVSLLLDRGADVNAVGENGWSPLEFAADEDPSNRSVALLIAAGADVDARDMWGATALHWAAHKGNAAAVRALLAAGVSKASKPWGHNWKDQTPFDVAESDAVRNLLRL